MNGCIRPPALDLAQLSAFVDGDADDAVRLHVEQCDSCRARAAQLAVAQSRLQTLLWRNACPAPEQLRDYAWDLLPQEEAQRVAQHVAFCPYCTHDFFADYYAGDRSGDDLFTQAARRVGQIEYRSAGRLEPAQGSRIRAAGAAGAAGEPQLFDAGDGVLVSLVALPDAAQPDRWALEGAISGLEPRGLQVNLWRDGQLVDAAVLDAGGDFRMTGLVTGAYQLVIHGPSTKLWIEPVQIRGL